MDNIVRVVGLDGYQNSGKSHIMKSFVSRLKGAGWSVKKIFAYSKDFEEISEIPKKDDYVIVLQKGAKSIVVATGGDYPSRVSGLFAIDISIEVTVLFAAMRTESPNVVQVFRDCASKRRLPLTLIFKPGFKGTKRYSNERLKSAENVYVMMLEKEVEK